MRLALYCALDEAFLPPPWLEAEGWRLIATDHPARLIAERQAMSTGIGIIAFNPQMILRERIESIIASSPQVDWLAVVPAKLEIEHKWVADTFADYHHLPIQPERLLLWLGHAHGLAELRMAASKWQAAPGEFFMVGRSLQMRQLYKEIRLISASDATALIVGETGTGKELAARAIHAASARKDGPYAAINAAALPETLIQAELFGYEKGAFTDARRRKIGKIEAAAGGTLFLDEVGDLPLSAQASLLRFLEEHTIERLGGKTPIRVDVRVIAATHVDLERLVREGRFREDLFYRLNVLRLQVPPLREREGDVELLANFILEGVPAHGGGRARGFAHSAIHRMNLHTWPGNVRELINRVHRAAVMCEGRLITSNDLGLERRGVARLLHTLEESRELAEERAIRAALVRCSTISSASQELGISRMTLYRLMSKYGLKHEEHTPPPRIPQGPMFGGGALT